MEDDSRIRGAVNWGLGAIGLGAIAAAVTIPHIGIWIGLAILGLGLLLFGGYYLWQRRRARRQREQFTSAIEAQAAAAPKAISDPNKRAALDKLRQKFQKGLQEYKSRGKDVYKLPWYVFIGEPGSGKSEAIRHSGIDFPPGLQDEQQGSGGTVNMDWWFTNRGIILDTAGSMIFREAGAGEAPEWREFLRLLKKARPHCPVNGLFMVLSIESLIKDSADTIAAKASKLAQQLDLIQRTLDVRFPVYLLVTKCDLLTGFREFFDSIDDPLLQHQIFGWSNPEPLDAHFRPDLVDQHLRGVAERLCRRRLALLRETFAAGRGDTTHFFAPSYQPGSGLAAPRRLDEVDALFALPKSMMLLAPRLRRYLETIFVAGEWSAKPVFLRGIYFTSSMREGKALDEAIAFATGLPLDQLPEDRSWEKNRAFFLRDLFLEKVFRESGLVTRATNTLKLLRTRKLAIFGTAGAALLLLLVFAGFSYRNLKNSVLKEAAYWQAGAASWNALVWSPSIVKPGQPPNVLHFSYGGTNQVEAVPTKPTVSKFHSELRKIVEKPLAVSLVFRPMRWLGFGNVGDRAKAQRILFEGGVLKPLLMQTRTKITDMNSFPADAQAVARHRDALLGLMQLEADGLIKGGDGFISDASVAERHLKRLVTYLTDGDWTPDTNVVNVLAGTYSKKALEENKGKWPPDQLLGGRTLASNLAIKVGLEQFHKASMQAQTNIDQHLTLVNALTDELAKYRQQEMAWLTNVATTTDPCEAFEQRVRPAKTRVDKSWYQLQALTNFPAGSLTNLASRYIALQSAASNASASALFIPVQKIVLPLTDQQKTTGLFREIQDMLGNLASSAGETVRTSFEARPSIPALDSDYLPYAQGGRLPSYQLRWSLYTGACALASVEVKPEIGDGWTQFTNLTLKAESYRIRMREYKGPYADLASNACERITADTVQKLKGEFVGSYVRLVSSKLSALIGQGETCDISAVEAARGLFEKVQGDWDARDVLGAEKDKLKSIRANLADAKERLLETINSCVRAKAGFPVRLDAKNILNGTELAELKKWLDKMEIELTKPEWTNFPNGTAKRDSVKTEINSYRSVTSALVIEGKPNDPMAKVRISFLPIESDPGFASQYRWIKLQVGNQWTDEKTFRADDPLIEFGEVPVNLEITFLFRDDRSPPNEKKKAAGNWVLPRFIRDKQATSKDGKKWRVHYIPEGEKTDSKGVVFDMELLQAVPSWLK